MRPSRPPSSPKQKRQRSESTKKLEADLKSYETKAFARKMADWETEKQASIVNRWLVIEPKATKTSNGSVLTKEPDGSIIVTGRNT